MTAPAPSATFSMTAPVKAQSAPAPKPDAPTEKRGGSGSAQKRGGSGLPVFEGIQWEQRTDRPAMTAWYAPQGARAHRNTKTYLGYISQKLLAEWLALPASERRRVIEAWITDAKAKKGLPR
ncbi:MAG: hypothetical protein HY011_18990 [Acidobacteria bacterium]|nr:hypothetical protein [Acidobacteriota bacterium]